MEESSGLVPKQIEFKDVLYFFNPKEFFSYQIFTVGVIIYNQPVHWIFIWFL